MTNFLEQIVSLKRKEIEDLKKSGSISLNDSTKVFQKNFSDRIKRKNKINCIAEIKRQSPSKGLLRENFDALEIAAIYQKLDVAAISVLTEGKYFSGSTKNLSDVKNCVNLPVLRKDFIIDAIQIYETAKVGADALLLIVKLLSVELLKEMIQITEKLGLEALVEVHNAHEIDSALSAGAKIIGVNNRDLESFQTDKRVSLNLVHYIPPDILKVSESGINSRDDITVLESAGYDAVLIGEKFMLSKNIESTYHELFNHHAS